MDKPVRKIKPPILRQDEEQEIVNTVSEKARKGEPVLRQDVIDLVVKFLKSDNRKNPFRNGIPGDKWFSLFRRRHNTKFLKLEPHMLKAVEKVGFTEKVMNTITYGKSTNPTRDPIFHTRIRRRSKPKVFATEVAGPSSAPMSSPGSDDGYNASQDESDLNRSQESVDDSGTSFEPGSKLEVMDFNDDKWYPVKVVEVDYEEGEVLVHFEKWSDRYDEWVRMDSNRIRRPQLPQTPSAKKMFRVGEKVMAVWTYNHKYPATVRKVLDSDKYEVLFCDGYAKVLRGCKLFKATEEDLKNVQIPPMKQPAPPIGADPLDPNLGPKEERRMKKRKLDVLEAYLPQKRMKYEVQSSPSSDTSPQPSTSTFRPREIPKVVLRLKGRPSVRIKSEYDSQEEEGVYSEDEDEDGEQESEALDGDEITPKKRGRKRRKKQPFDEATYEYKPNRPRLGTEEDSERWNTDIPEGVKPVFLKDQEGYYRESIIIPDKKLPPGWTKHTMRRKNGAKWDVFLVNPDGRKFRSRNELRNYFAELKMPFPEESFDFMVGRKMEMIRTQAELRRKSMPGSPVGKVSVKRKSSPGCKASPTHKPADEDAPVEVKKEKVPVEVPEGKRIKTMLPKSKQVESGSGSGTGSGEDVRGDSSAGAPPNTAPAPSTPAMPTFPFADKRTPDGGFTCCGKNFRKENLFQMHMKHYHPEYNNLFGSTPNVADLAYARTVGEPIEDSRSEAMTPKSSFMERVNKYEAQRKAAAETPTTTKVQKSSKEEKTPTAAPSPAVEEPKPLEVVDVKKEEPTSEVETKKEDVTDKEKAIEDAKEEEKAESSAGEEVEMENDDRCDTPTLEEKEEDTSEQTEKKSEEHVIPNSSEVKEDIKSTSTETVPPPPSPPLPVTPSLPVIKPVSKVTSNASKTTVTSEAVIVQTTSSAKTPITITKYVPPGQKATPSTAKVTISVKETDKEKEKEVKSTIKTLLPMRPPPLAESKEAPETQKPKEVKSKEEAEEDMPNKSRPRKRTVSESLPKKPKLSKPTTGSLEEEPTGTVATTPVVPKPTVAMAANNTSYRFSRNRSLPRVKLEKLSVTPDSNGRVVLPTTEDKTDDATGIENAESVEQNNQSLASDVVYENLRKEEIINCTCGYMEEDGLMIQCDLCLCWQHGLCNNIDKEADVPEKYVCKICLNPSRQRSSTRHSHNQDWLKEGKLPSLSFKPQSEESTAQRESMLKKSHDLVASLLQLKTVIRSLRVKTHIATKPDHPKLYLWAKSWKNDVSDMKNAEEAKSKQDVLGPQPEAAIDATECRLRLLEHVEDYQHQVDDRLTSIQAQIAALESEDPDLASDEVSDNYPITKQTVQMILRDLNTVQKVAALN